MVCYVSDWSSGVYVLVGVHGLCLVLADLGKGGCWLGYLFVVFGLSCDLLI